MHLSSLRTRVTLVGAALATLLVSAVLVMTYVVVAGGMADVASRETARLAERAVSDVRAAVTQASLQARTAGLTGKDAVDMAELTFSQSIPERFGVGQGLLEGHFAFYDPADSEPQYVSDQLAVVADEAGRKRAATNDESVSGTVGGQPLLANLIAKPDLGAYVVHVPFKRPNGKTWVLDVVYYPTRETESIEQIRIPMIVLSILAVALAIAIMRSAANWVLRLVDELRIAADSVDAGVLSVRLPQSGSNEISELARSLNTLIERLRHRAEAQTRFVADASHELATPVAGIRGYVSILRGWGADDLEVREEALDAIDRESERMLRLTRQLLALIRSEQELEFHSLRHDINAGVREVLANAATRYTDKGLEFVGPDEGPLMIHGDPDRMVEVIGILVDNAAKYTAEGGKVAVTTSRRKGDVLIEVSDTGPGIPADELPSIFERFYRSDASRSARSGGFGLGLAIAKRIVESAGGLIDVRSELGEGTTFTIRVPRGRD
jgi:signal transduction histidine kinase